MSDGSPQPSSSDSLETKPLPGTTAPRKRRRWPLLLVGLILIAIVLVGLAPALLGSGPGRGLVASFVNKAIAGSVKIETLSLSWTGGQSLGGLSLLDPAGETVLTVESISTQLSLLDAIRGTFNLGDVPIEGVRGQVVADADGSTNLLRAVASNSPAPPSDAPTKLPPSLKLNLSLSNAELSVSGAGIEPTQLKAVSVNLVLPGEGAPIDLAVAASALQGDLQGQLSLQGNIDKLIAKDGTLDTNAAVFDLTLVAEGLPSDGLDGLAGMRGRLAAAIGRKVDVITMLAGPNKDLNLTVRIAAPNLHASIVARRTGDGLLEMTESSTAELNVTPAFIESLLGDGTPATASQRLHGRELALLPAAAAGSLLAATPAAAFKLEAPAKVMLIFDAMAINPANLQTAVLRAAVEAKQPMRFTGEGVGEAIVESFALEIDTRNLGESLRIEADATLKVNGRPGLFALDATAKQLFDEKGTARFADAQISAEAKAENLPLALIDRLASQNGRLSALLGDRLDLEGSADTTAGNDPQASLTVSTDTLKAGPLQLSLGETIELRQPAEVHLTLSPAAAKALLGEDAAVSLSSPTKLKLTLGKLLLTRNREPGEGEPAIHLGRSLLAATLTSDRIAVTGPPAVGPAVLSNATLRIDAATLSSIQAKLSADLAAAGDTTLADLLGSSGGNLSTDMTIDLKADASPARIAATADVVAASLEAHLDANVAGEPRELRVVDSRLKARFTPRLLSSLTGAEAGSESPLDSPLDLEIRIDRLRAGLAAGGLDNADLAASLVARAVDPQSKAATLLGTQFSVDAKVAPAPEGSRTVTLAITSTPLNGSLDATLLSSDAGTAMKLTRPGKLSLQLSNDLLAALGSEQRLAKPATIEVDLQRLDALAAPFDTASVVAKLSARTDEIRLAGDGDLAGSGLIGTTAELVADLPAGTAGVTLSGKAAAPGNAAPGPLSAKLLLSKLLGADGKVSTDAATLTIEKLDLQQLPTAFVDALAGLEGRGTALIGETLNLQAGGELAPLADPRGSLTIKLASPQLSADAALKLTDAIELSAPAGVKLKLTPAGFAAWTRGSSEQPRLVLSSPAEITANVASLRWPRGGEGFQPAAASIAAGFSAGAMQFRDTVSNSDLTLSNLRGEVKAADFSKPIDASVSVDITGANEPGKLQLKAQLAKAFAADGAFNFDAADLNLDATITALPVVLVDALTAGDGLYLAALGEKLNATAKAQLVAGSGPLSMDLVASSASAKLRANLEPQWIRLTEPVTAELTITQQLSDRLFARLSPLLRGVKKTEPATLRIDHEGFGIPRPFDIATLAVPAATLDLGRVTLENDRLMKGLMALLRRPSRDQMPGWFTPAVVSVSNGQVRFTRRMDLLLDRSFQIAIWGQADLRTADGAQSSYQQTLALTPQALDNAFGIDGLDPNDMMRIPVRGSSGAPQIDFGKATTDLGKLIAQREAAKANPLAGAIAKRLLGELLGGETPPPASVQPFPWAGQIVGAEPTAEATAAPAPEPAKADPAKRILDLFK